MITVQGVAVASKNASKPISTKGDSFLPVAVNVSGQRDKADWQTLRVYAREASHLEALHQRLTEKRSIIVKATSNLFSSTYEKDGEVRASVNFSTNLRGVKAFDNESKQWVALADLLGVEVGEPAAAAAAVAAPADPEFPPEADLPF